MQNKLVKEYYHIVQQILKTQLKEQDHSYQYLSLTVLVYSFRIVIWVRNEIEQMDRKVIKLVTVEGINHMKTHINRLYIKR